MTSFRTRSKIPCFLAVASITIVIAGCGAAASAAPSVVDSGAPTPSASVPTASASPPDDMPRPTSASPTAYAAATTFISPLYGYSVRLPAGWTVIPATAAWDGTSVIGHDDSDVDQLLAPRVQNRCANIYLCGPNAWALASPTTMSLAQLVAAGDASEHRDHPCPARPESTRRFKVAGVDAVFESKHCEPVTGILVMSVRFVSKGVGYGFFMQDPSRDRDVEPLDRADFMKMLATVSLP